MNSDKYITKSNSVNEDSIGSRIKKSRLTSKLSQEELAEELGCDIRTVSRYESDVFPNAICFLSDLCEILNVSADYILFGKDYTFDLFGIIRELNELSDKSKEEISEICKSGKKK